MIKVLPPPKPDIPEPLPGKALSVAPAGHTLWLDDYEYYDQLGRDPLQQARLWLIKDPEERVSKLKEVLESYPKQKHRREMLFRAAVRGDEALVRCIVATGLKVHPDIPEGSLTEEEQAADDEARENGEIPDRDDPSIAPVHAAANNGHVRCLQILLEEGKVDVDVHDDLGRTPLHAGASEPEVVRYLLGMGADPTARANSDTELAQEYLGEYAGSDALEVAAGNANVESLRLLLEHPFHGSTRKRKSHADEEPGVWVTPLSIKGAAGHMDGYDALKLLLERGAYPMDAQDGKTKGELLSDDERKAIEEATPGAAMDGSLESLKLLLSYQYPTDPEGNILSFEVPEELHKPLVYGAYGAMVANSPEKFEFINSLGIKEHETMSLDELPPDQNFNIQHLLDKAAEAGSIDCIRLLIEKYSANPNRHRLPPGTKPLYVAAANDKPDMVRYLLESHGADIHLGSGRYATGPTALFIAIGLKSLDSVAILLQHGGPVDHVDEEIRNLQGPVSAVLKAVSDGSASSVRLETEQNAKEYLKGYKGNWQNLNPPFVRLEIGPEDRGVIGSLRTRRPEGELREAGDGARELNEQTGVRKRDLKERDPRRLMVAFPTVKGRDEELRKDDDLIPEFTPFMRHVRDDSD